MESKCDPSNKGFATITKSVVSMMNVAQRINEVMRRHENNARIRQIHTKLLYGYLGGTLYSLGELLLEVRFHFLTSAYIFFH